jgi:hypothetical protein
VVHIEARAKSDLEDPSGQPARQLGAPFLQSGGPTRSVDQDWEDVVAVEAHVARVPIRSTHWSSGTQGWNEGSRTVICRLVVDLSGCSDGHFEAPSCEIVSTRE